MAVGVCRYAMEIQMKKIVFSVLLFGALTSGLVRAQLGYDQSCRLGACVYNNGDDVETPATP
jgi:hypothetical protein